MQPVEVPQSRTSPGLNAAGESAAAWRVAEALPSGRGRLVVRFRDGLSGEVDLEAFLSSPAVVGTLFEPLRDDGFFQQVQAAEGVVRWPNGADLAPDAMYDAIRSVGRWVVP